MNQHDRRIPRTRAARFTALSRAGTALMRAGDEGSVLRVLTHTARDLSGAAFAAVIVRPLPEEHEEGGPPAPPVGARVHLVGVVGLSQEQEASLRRVLLSREELLAPLWQRGELLRVPGPFALALLEEESATSAGQEAIAQTAQEQPQEEGPARRQPAGQPLVPALLAVPLLAFDGQVQGGLLVGLHKQAQVSRKDEALLVSLAAQAALALEKVRCARLAQELQTAMGLLTEGVTLLDAHGRVVQENGQRGGCVSTSKPRRQGNRPSTPCCRPQPSWP